MKKTLYILLLSGLIFSLSYAKHAINHTAIHRSKTGTSQVLTSSPDAWGYTWTRSDESGGPTYIWLDSTAGWQRVTGLQDDNAVGLFSLGFDFPYYWYSARKLQICSNGWISFQSSLDNLAADFMRFPNANTPNDVIAPLAADFDFTITGYG